VLICAATDLSFSGETITSNARHDLILNLTTVRQEVKLFMGESDPRDPRVSPLYANLHGLPHIYIQAGGHDILLSDSTRLADRLKEAGVPVTLDVVPDGQHVFVFAAPIIPEARRALERIGQFIRSV
jgi:acetyl esterase/lipase